MYSFHILLERQLKRNIPCLKVKLKLIVEHKTKQNITKQSKTKQTKNKNKQNEGSDVNSHWSGGMPNGQCLLGIM